MARTARLKSSGEGTAYYHLISRCSNRQFLFRKAAAKDRLMDLAKRAAEFSGVKLLALTIMDNHFHILCSVTQSNELVSQEEIIRRVGILKGEAAAQELRERWENFEAAGFVSMLEVELYRYRARINDISAFMKTMKELFAIWYNRKYDYCLFVAWLATCKRSERKECLGSVGHSGHSGGIQGRAFRGGTPRRVEI